MDKKVFASKIYAHRGFWNSKFEQNTLRAFESAFLNGFSVETDFREHHGKVVISHDLISEDNDLLDLDSYSTLSIKTAINIKTDGLSGIFNKSRTFLESTKSWVFDCSIPEMLKYQKLGIKHALRISEIERDLPWISPVIWFDCFIEDWYVEKPHLLEKYSNSEIVLVSPEIHGRDFRNVWDYYGKILSIGFMNVSICTDFPDKIMRDIYNEV